MTEFPVTNALAHISSFHRQFGPRFLRDEIASRSDDSISLTQAATALSSSRNMEDQDRTSRAAAPEEPDATKLNEPSAERAATATAEHELSSEDNAAPGEDQRNGETESTQNVSAETPKPIPLPKSWAKEQETHWNALPRETQEYLAHRDSKINADTQKVQREAAEKTKALTAKEQAAEEVRTQYEGKLKSVVEILEREQLTDFPDIRSQDDIDKMVNEAVQLSAQAQQLWETDPLQAGQVHAKVLQIQSKLSAWDTHQRKLVAATNDLKASEERAASKKSESLNAYIQEQNRLAIEKIPELADKTKGPALRSRAVESLVELGFSQDELTKIASGEESLSIHDHRLQQLIHSHLRLAEILNAPRAVATKPLPPVQRPGTPPQRGSAPSEAVKALTNKLNNSGSLKDAVELHKAQTRSRQRRA